MGKKKTDVTSLKAPRTVAPRAARRRAPLAPDAIAEFTAPPLAPEVIPPPPAHDHDVDVIDQVLAAHPGSRPPSARGGSGASRRFRETRSNSCRSPIEACYASLAI